MNNDIPQTGSVVRFGPWNGVILDVFESPSSNKHILQIMFAKNIYKQQPAELHIYEEINSGLLLLSTREALSEELTRHHDSALVEADKLLEKVASSTEPTIPAKVEARV